MLHPLSYTSGRVCARYFFSNCVSLLFFLCVSWLLFALVIFFSLSSNTILKSIILWNNEVQGTFDLCVTILPYHKPYITVLSYMHDEQAIWKGELFYLIIVLLSISIRNRSSQAFFISNYSYYYFGNQWNHKRSEIWTLNECNNSNFGRYNFDFLPCSFSLISENSESTRLRSANNRFVMYVLPSGSVLTMASGKIRFPAFG